MDYNAIYINGSENQDTRRVEYEMRIKEIEAIPNWRWPMPHPPTEDEFYSQYDRWEHLLLVQNCREIHGIEPSMDFDTRKLQQDFKAAKENDPTIDYKTFCDTYQPTYIKSPPPSPGTLQGAYGHSYRMPDVLTRWEGNGRNAEGTGSPGSPSEGRRPEAPPPRPTRFRSRAEARDLPPPVWLVDKLLQADSDCVIYAESQSLKTFIAIDIGLALVTGRDALGMFPIGTKGITFYFAGEGRNSLDKERLTAWEISNGFEPYSLNDIWTTGDVTMSTNDDLEEIIADIETIIGDRKGKQPVFFIIDTLSRALNEGDEDKSNIAARYLNMVKKIRERVGGTSLTIAHTGKDKTRGIRGSSGFFGGFDTVLFIENCIRDDKNKTHTLDILIEKQRDDEDGQRYYLQSEKIITPTGSSLVLHPLAEEDGRNLIKGSSPVTQEAVIHAIKELGGTATKRALAKLLADKLGRSIDGVEKQLDRAKDKFQKFCHDGKWSLPSYYNGSDESYADQISSLKHDKESMFQ